MQSFMLHLIGTRVPIFTSINSFHFTSDSKCKSTHVGLYNRQQDARREGKEAESQQERGKIGTQHQSIIPGTTAMFDHPYEKPQHRTAALK
jgi:hypothetical protein